MTTDNLADDTRAVLAGTRTWVVDQADCLTWLRQLPEQSLDLVLGSPPYEKCRLYLESGKDLHIARETEAWVAWMVEVFQAALRACKGLVAFVVEGQTADFRYSCGPALLMADLHRVGVHLRKPVIFHRVGIPGSGGSRKDHEACGGGADWLRNDYEFVICATRGGKLPWADGTALGHVPKWAPGGEMSHRLSDGTRVNQWGGHAKSSQQRRADGSRQPGGRPSHVLKTSQEQEVDMFGENLVENGLNPKPLGRGRNGEGSTKGSCMYRLRTDKRVKDGSRCGEETQIYLPPVLANPGNVIKTTFTSDEVRQILAEHGIVDEAASEILSLKVGGGLIGNRLAHRNEAPYPEALAEFFIRSFCPPEYCSKCGTVHLSELRPLNPKNKKTCQTCGADLSLLNAIRHGIVCDPFSGSGTTGAVAVRWGRRFVGCDLRESQVALSRLRIAGEMTLFHQETTQETTHAKPE